MSNKNQPSISLTHAGYNVRVVLDRKGIAYPIWQHELPNGWLLTRFVIAFHKAARSLGAKGWVRV